MALTEQTRAEMAELAARYPQARSALLPMLHLAQSEEGYVTEDAIIMCADVLGLTTAEVKGVATFYTMFKHEPVGEYHVGVCINPGCGILGGDAIWETLSEELGVGHDEVTADGKISLERIECQAACTHAPVLTANWEFMDDMTPQKARQLIEDLRAGREVTSTRGPVIRDFKATERTLSGIDDDGLAGIPATDDLMLAGLKYAQAHDMAAPEGKVI
ncbi:MAG: NAD(P)H-dependent oxidoreductase subunit E [Candidatus Nanopelagicales bacterium]